MFVKKIKVYKLSLIVTCSLIGYGSISIASESSSDAIDASTKTRDPISGWQQKLEPKKPFMLDEGKRSGAESMNTYKLVKTSINLNLTNQLAPLCIL